MCTRELESKCRNICNCKRHLMKSGVLKKLVRLIKMCLTETYSRVRVGKNLSDMFPIRNGLKQRDALLPLLFNFALEYVIRGVQVNQDALKLNGTHVDGRIILRWIFRKWEGVVGTRCSWLRIGTGGGRLWVR